MTIDLAAVEAIDVHVHAEVGRAGEDGLRPEWRQAAAAYFGEHGLPTADDVVAHYRERKIAAVIFTVDAETVTGRPAVPNEEIAEVAAANTDVLIPFASIDPKKGTRAVEEAKRLIRDFGFRGFKFHPNIQAFYPKRPLGLSAVRGHCRGRAPGPLPHGTLRDRLRAAGRRWHPPEVVEPHVRGRRRRRLPRAEDRPRATVVPLTGRGDLGRAPQAAGLGLSGWSPKYFAPQLVQYANTLLRDRVLFGSDYPLITPDRWLEDFARADFKDEVRPLVLKQNAARLLGLTE